VTLSPKQERDLMRSMGWWRTWDTEYFSRRFKFGSARTKRLLADLIERGLIERVKPGMLQRTSSPSSEERKIEKVGRKATYRITEAGHRLAAKSLLKRIPLAKADLIVAELIERAKAINARPELMMGVTEIRVFGSYMRRKRTTVLDVDIAVSFYRKPGPDRNKWHAERVRATAPEWIARDVNNGWGELEVQRLLKGGNRYLHMCDWEHLKEQDHMRVRGRVIFSAKPEEIACRTGSRDGGPSAPAVCPAGRGS
jgi:predicted nucleotidyltransferase